MANSIAEAYVTPTAWPRAICDGDDVVGFVGGPEQFYLRCGFEPTGERLFGQVLGTRSTHPAATPPTKG